MTLELLRSDLLKGTQHGFFTRRGGASSGIYAGLNCGSGSGDQGAAVNLNRARVAAAMGVAPERLLSLRQVHSIDVAEAGPEGWSGDGSERPLADAAVTRERGIALSVLTADCAPVLLADREAGVIGAAHAGWRGAIGGIIVATVEAMERLGAERSRIRAAIGPTISQRAYEVGPEMLDAFCAEDPGFSRFFANGKGDRLHFDLPGFVLDRLRHEGVEAEWTGHCTFSDPGRFFSYRRATHAGEKDYGRLIAAITLAP